MKSNNNHKQPIQTNMHIQSNNHQPTTVHHIKSTNLQFKYIQNKCDVNEINLFHEKFVGCKRYKNTYLFQSGNKVSWVRYTNYLLSLDLPLL